MKKKILFYLKSFVRAVIFIILAPIMVVVVLISLTLLLIAPVKDK